VGQTEKNSVRANVFRVTAGGRDVDVQSAAVSELVRFICGLGFADLDIGQHRRPTIPGFAGSLPGFVPGFYRVWTASSGMDGNDSDP
jgi:hypothetical protein